MSLILYTLSTVIIYIHSLTNKYSPPLITLSCECFLNTVSLFCVSIPLCVILHLYSFSFYITLFLYHSLSISLSFYSLTTQNIHRGHPLLFKPSSLPPKLSLLHTTSSAEDIQDVFLPTGCNFFFIFECSLSVACSTRPQHCLSYPFNINTHFELDCAPFGIENNSLSFTQTC